MFSQHSDVILKLLSRKGTIEEHIIVNSFLSEKIDQLTTLCINVLESGLQLIDLGLNISVFVLFAKDKISFEFVPANVKITFVTFLYLLSGFELLPWRKEYFHFWAELRIKLAIIDYDVEKTSNHFGSSFDELLIFADRYFRLHKSKKSISWKSRKDETSLLLWKNLNIL